MVSGAFAFRQEQVCPAFTSMIEEHFPETLHRIIVALKSDSGVTGQPEFKFKGFPIRS